ncbi:MAG: DUF956 family protein [Streptococcaceae bacterium]|jgi:hypothetical protein|nr:DUF956 family protein [Streptococcaceae bacterium]
MAQSLNTKVELTGEAIAYAGFPQYGKFMIGDYAFEFFDDRSVEKNMQFPWESIKLVQGSITGNRKKPAIGRTFYVVLKNGNKVRFNSQETGKILKIFRERLGNDKVVKAPTFTHTWRQLFKLESWKNTFRRKKKAGRN